MSIDEIVEREVLGEASRACDLLIEKVRGRVAGAPQTAAELGQLAGAALEAYYDTLLRTLMAAATRRPQDGDIDVWVKRQFHAGLDRAGTALREAVAESPHRHSVAQKLQQKMFEGEVSLRRALAGRNAAADAGSGAARVSRQKIAG